MSRNATRTASLISALAAGSLAMGLVAAPAFADAPAPDAAPSSGATYASLLNRAPGEEPNAVADGAVSAEDIVWTDGFVSLEVPGDWQFIPVTDDGLEYATFWSDNSYTQIVTIPNDYKASEDDATQEFMDALEADLDLDEAVFGTPQDRIVDGVYLRDVTYSFAQAGLAYDGMATFVFGEGFTSLIASYYISGEQTPVEAIAQVAQLHTSAAPALAGTPAPAEDAPAGEAAPTEGTKPPLPSSQTAPVSHPGAVGDLSVSFVIDDVRYTLGTDPAAYEVADGTIAIPLAIANADNEPQRSEQIEVTVTRPDGTAEVVLIDSGDLDVAASTQGVLSITDGGAGLYQFAVDEVDHDLDEDDALRFSVML